MKLIKNSRIKVQNLVKSTEIPSNKKIKSIKKKKFKIHPELYKTHYDNFQFYDKWQSNKIKFNALNQFQIKIFLLNQHKMDTPKILNITSQSKI